MSKSCRPIPVFRRRQRGFSLVEVLVSIVVLSFGMLGMVGLQAAALQANREAKYQSAAVTLARELAEMMRGNKDVAIDTTAAKNPYLRAVSAALTAPTPSRCLDVAASTRCSAVAITPPDPHTNATPQQVTIANAQMTEWLERLDAEVPGAKVAVCFDTAPYDTTTGLPKWTCSNSGTTAYIKIGWTRASTNRAATGAAAFDRGTAPAIVVPVTAGSGA